MNLSCGIVGLPNVGKSTLFNALLAKQAAEASNYPFCTIEPNVGIVAVPDCRLPVLADIVHTEKIVPSVVKFVDIAGLIKGASSGEGLGNKFLSHIREVAIIIHVLRAFHDENVIKTGETPEDDYETVVTELCLADLQTLTKQKEPKMSKDKSEVNRWQAIVKLRKMLESGKEARHTSLSSEEQELTKDLFLLTSKPVIHVINIDEKDYSKIDTIIDQYKGKNWEVVPICAKIEEELISMSETEKREYLKELGVSESGLERLISKAFDTLNLQSFLTAGEKEVRAWTIKKNTKAPQAAGEIHTDFEKKFIKAQISTYTDFVEYKGWKTLKEIGKVRIEGKDYVMKDNDVVEFMIGK
ncbi:redox-regulated ATPase YchF [candidate division CPR3 bacterium GWF2_35_18]|uniref:GTP-binding protein YchF n=1 Tax=candidate division CPR3 bacterium GW2011_GWF2_35_18 TaxID=1618350 RepID=A0A0G0BKB7_UNCC3|nr:MAG: GTP-binding protein YchF [candidate division CPR3 bacterium GW2011_GWF2_35_18]KKP86289.1 MAG: GTP-binding protein YchF [candidate division CPR3 bacterium GW2011_GWE2_35_7]OGB62748.1 MAG: redox-regulated ATPase YchF [candidate division CPR3 bacterium GWF2_35_18]OGB65329.1 MAG: redox-regulated ATPase YchF [candidate division CPR3 bacterium RIFOXYA2_FULL_35_13]OGB78292.1 MAG: redox-regulated ATPase YchF [candidate division CPR3 bacterium RIFOXYB2_FULL_35_8]OGB80288.1 MAG: redox-regulated 